MEAHKEKILERYGYLKRELAMSYLGHPRMEELKLEMAKVIFDMEVNDLKPEDYLDFKNKRKESAQKQAVTRKVEARKKTTKKAILFFALGLPTTLLGIGLSELTNGGIIFYGLIVVGIVLMGLGGVEVYANKMMK